MRRDLKKADWCGAAGREMDRDRAGFPIDWTEVLQAFRMSHSDDRAPYQPLYLEGISLFNQREFFACHDALEELWTETLGPEREFYQGLIQAAVALFHYSEGNTGGARRMCESSIRYLEPYRPDFLGLDIDRFLTEFRDCCRELLQATTWPGGLSPDPQQFPVLVLNAEPGGPSAALEDGQ